jgi:hypothetical protein
MIDYSNMDEEELATTLIERLRSYYPNISVSEVVDAYDWKDERAPEGNRIVSFALHKLPTMRSLFSEQKDPLQIGIDVYDAVESILKQRIKSPTEYLALVQGMTGSQQRHYTSTN